MSNTTAFSFEQILALDKPQHLTESLFASKDGIAEKAFISVEGEWRVMFHGVDPSLTEGHLLRDGASLTLLGELQIRNFRALSLEPHCVLAASYERK